MKKITHLFFDIGGVILTNGWDHLSRQRSAKYFGYDYEKSDEIHYKLADKFEKGKISRDEYLDRIIFYKERDFSKKEIIEFMESQSELHQTSLEILKKLCSQRDFHISTLNNESLELNLFRMKKFGLTKYFTNFFSSCFLGVKKPEREIFQKVLWITQKSGEQCLFIDDRVNNIESAKNCGFNALHLQSANDLENLLIKNGVLNG
jgi:putative hydrolase of the HAD superfamily